MSPSTKHCCDKKKSGPVSVAGCASEREEDCLRDCGRQLWTTTMPGNPSHSGFQR